MNVLGWGATTPPRPAPCWHCGHDRALHQHHRIGTNCGGCGCPRYRPRRWWRRTPNVPAAVTVTQATAPPRWPDPPPGPPTWIHRVTYGEAGCGCFEIINHIRRTRRLDRCQRHAFEAHWEERIRQP